MNINLLNRVIRLLRCPQTGNKLVLDDINNKLIVDKQKIEYLITDGIVDFIPKETEESLDLYVKRAKSYEKIFKNPSLFIRTVDKVVWGIKHKDYVQIVLNYLSDSFDGILFDIPVGTGILTLEKYKKLSNAIILAVDYSMNMLKFAKERYLSNNIKNVIFIHADVSKLPFSNKIIDAIISMNGYHAFKDKYKTIKELNRVLKPIGQFIGCFYTKGKKKVTDIAVKRYYSKKGWFQPPYYTQNEIFQKFSNYFTFKEIATVKSMFIFNSQKLG